MYGSLLLNVKDTRSALRWMAARLRAGLRRAFFLVLRGKQKLHAQVAEKLRLADLRSAEAAAGHEQQHEVLSQLVAASAIKGGPVVGTVGVGGSIQFAIQFQPLADLPSHHHS